MSRVTVITGARKGIGRFLAEHYLAAGHRVVGLSRESSDLNHDDYSHLTVDVSDESAVVDAFTAIRRSEGAIDNLLNCAGVASMNHFLLTPVSTVRRVLETNVVGTFLCSREAAKVMQRAKRGRIVNFTSVAVPMKLAGEAAYAASKAAVEALTAVTAIELAPLGITVNSVGPTVIDTDLTRGVPSDRLDALVNRQALRRRGTMEELAAVVDFFLADANTSVTGQTVYLGGP